MILLDLSSASMIFKVQIGIHTRIVSLMKISQHINFCETQFGKTSSFPRSFPFRLLVAPTVLHLVAREMPVGPPFQVLAFTQGVRRARVSSQRKRSCDSCIRHNQVCLNCHHFGHMSDNKSKSLKSSLTWVNTWRGGTSLPKPGTCNRHDTMRSEHKDGSLPFLKLC